MKKMFKNKYKIEVLLFVLAYLACILDPRIEVPLYFRIALGCGILLSIFEVICNKTSCDECIEESEEEK